MSRFSGKCDFYDEICIFGLEKILAGKVYVGNSKVPLKLESIKDCVPYFSYVACWLSSNDKGVSIGLTEKSWVDMEEERYGKMAIHNYYRQLLAEELEKYK